MIDWFDIKLLLKRRMVCSWRGHDDVDVIKGLRFDRAEHTVHYDGLSIAARIGTTERYCLRCRRRAT